ncbi:SDR family oxidoreductase [Zwartia sp.]|uniref:SDR family oxidoreductase n=1 Tax=Zwartia sp. TaxID=2978004 RepID=UPI003BAECEED
MDLGIRGRRAIVCASSKGLGLGCAQQLAREGVELVMLARGQEALEAAAAAIRAETGVKVTTVATDITTPEGRAKVLAICPDPDILVTNAGGPKPGDFRDWSREDWIAAVDANMLTPIELIRATVDKMIARKFGRIVNITSASVKHPIESLGMSNGARAGLTGFVAGLARQIISHNVTINNLLPGPFATDRILQNAQVRSRETGQAVDDILTARMAAVPAKRFGTPAEFGQACAFLCSASSGFMTGQNLVLDGGIYPGTL